MATGYLRIQQAMEQQLINEKQVSISRTQLGQIHKAAAAGVLPDLNVAQLQAQLATDSANLTASIAAVQNAILDMKAVLNIGFEVPFVVTAPPADAMAQVSMASSAPDVVYAEAVHTFGTVRAARLRSDAADKQLWAARGALLPRFSIGAEYGTAYASVNRNYTLTGYETTTATGVYTTVNGTQYPIYEKTAMYDEAPVPFGSQFNGNAHRLYYATLTVPLFNGWAAGAGVKRARLTQDYRRLQETDANIHLKQEIYKACSNAKIAVQTYIAAQRAMDAATRALNFAQQRYNVGLSNTVEYLTILNAQYNASHRLLAAKYRPHMAAAGD